MKKREETFLLEPERYEFRAMPMHQFALGRRDFFKIFGAGLAVFAVAKDVSAMQETAPGPHGFHNEELPKEIGAWLHIGEDGTVTGFAGKAELGQNVRTSLAQTIADELGVALASVRMVLADTALTPFDAGTFGSRTTPTITPQLRKVAAAARELLVAKAAKQWNVPADKLVAGDGKVSDPASGKSLRYAELAREDIGAQKPPVEDPIKPASQWTIAGKAIPKVDGREFVTGGHRYTTDLRPEGMLYGKILRPPSFGATLISYDHSIVKEWSDVVLVRDGDFVGAAAPTVARAEAALAGLRVEWKEVPQISDQEIFSYLKKNAQPSAEARFRQAKGSVEEGLAAAAHK
ncbi:MAG TPA: molybdopterin cofactor-binding domain-containing protein, partial [Terracidiphilus sp.]